MVSFRSLVLLFGFLALDAIGTLTAQEVGDEYDPFDPESTYLPESHWPEVIKFDYRAYDVPLAKADELTRSRKLVGQDDELLATLSKLSVENTVKLVELANTTGRPGETVTIQSVEEIIYETEYLPPYQPQEPDEEESAPQMDGANTSAIATPSAFETWHAGLSLEMESTLGDQDNIIDFRFALEQSELVRFEPIAKVDEAKSHFPFSMPRFHIQQISTSHTVGSGHSLLLGITTPLNEQKEPSKTHRRMHFMTVNIDRIKPTQN